MISGLPGVLRRVLCGHHSRETVTIPESGTGWTGVRLEAHCLDCGKELRP